MSNNAQHLILLLLAFARRSAVREELVLSARKYPEAEVDAALAELVKSGHLRISYELTDAGRAAVERS